MTTTNSESSSNTAVNPIKSTNHAELIRALTSAELIRALTPITIAIIGGIIGLFAILSNDIDANELTAAMGLAGTALAGASGLAQQSNKNE